MKKDIPVIMDTCGAAGSIISPTPLESPNQSRTEILVACGYSKMARGQGRRLSPEDMMELGYPGLKPDPHYTFPIALSEVLENLAGSDMPFSVTRLHSDLLKAIMKRNCDKIATDMPREAPFYIDASTIDSMPSMLLKPLRKTSNQGSPRPCTCGASKMLDARGQASAERSEDDKS